MRDCPITIFDPVFDLGSFVFIFIIPLAVLMLMFQTKKFHFCSFTNVQFLLVTAIYVCFRKQLAIILPHELVSWYLSNQIHKIDICYRNATCWNTIIIDFINGISLRQLNILGYLNYHLSQVLRSSIDRKHQPFYLSLALRMTYYEWHEDKFKNQ